MLTWWDSWRESEANCAGSVPVLRDLLGAWTMICWCRREEVQASMGSWGFAALYIYMASTQSAMLQGGGLGMYTQEYLCKSPVLVSRFLGFRHKQGPQ